MHQAWREKKLFKGKEKKFMKKWWLWNIHIYYIWNKKKKAEEEKQNQNNGKKLMLTNWI